VQRSTNLVSYTDIAARPLHWNCGAVLRFSSGKAIATNTGWENTSVSGPSTVPASIQPATSFDFDEVGAFDLASGSADCAMVAMLPPGAYTVQVSGVGNTTGIGLVEAYELP
jgi:hypothetical protein